jgi:hypothetical protein
MDTSDLEIDGSDWDRLEEELAIAAWRTERLLSLGYDLREAAFLALMRVDIHELERLIVQGCPPETAARIAA